MEPSALSVVQDVLYCFVNGVEKRVGALYRCIPDALLDPVTFDAESTIGVPGLMAAYRAGNVAILNAPGSGVMNDYLFYYYMAYHNTYVASVSGRNRIQIVYSPSKHQVVYGNGNLCPILTQEVVSSKEVYSLDENEAIALAKKALSEAGIKDARFVSAKPVYVNNFGDISFEDQTMTLIPAWRVEYTVEKNGKTIRNWLHLNAETGEVYDNTIKL